ncbi:MAG: cytoskeletal protein CcmA (bactofilin family) [Porticoccaceae bacterium]|jgi:cytoskeletal protein CcmA (bactofilin family)|nr:polymer-forming cytoskeletal protein [SAR92 clade bacterium]MDB9978630.1 polymer-forming cytoskeletal protein [Porticoccaceae bacterium]|tara:strand:- start:743 stop:1192 length:450 start_codon:yes stop_codon:yes gene_type:complete
MFTNKNTSESLAPSSESTTLVAAGTELKGDLNFSGSLEIQGSIVGKIVADDETAQIRILNGGSVLGEIWVPNVIVNGLIEGDIYASKHIQLAAKAKVEGTIYYSSIEIERGADIGGKLVHEIPATNVTAFQKAGEASDSSSGHKPKVEK